MKAYLFLFLILFNATLAHAQKIHVNGLVLDSYDNMPLPGATVQVLQEATSTVTDFDGKFRMYAMPGQSLVVRYLGYKEQVFIVPVDESLVTIILEEDVTQLIGVEVTGALGISRAAKEMGTSAQIVKSDELNQGRVVNPIFGLASKVAGLRINQYDSKVDPAAQIILRGTRSLQRGTGIDGRSNNEPIYVVDGVPIPNIGRLNPNDIESITV
ncbi:MAG TPA: carboxypeptidase-like regulatory domain-containing protein, partial [Arenibacter sp.]|nr:carboxypeptidase-like regulatory domain-containing protein [Arenibacter sp.]